MIHFATEVASSLRLVEELKQKRLHVFQSYFHLGRLLTIRSIPDFPYKFSLWNHAIQIRTDRKIEPCFQP